MKKTILLILLVFLCKSNAQNVSAYLFSQSTETYTPVVGTNSTAIGDDGVENAIPIGFGFNYGGILYSTFSISTNGWIRLGGDVGANSYINALANANAQSPLIAAFWDDHNRTTGAIQYSVSGTAPNRKLEIGWDTINLAFGGVENTIGFGSFKMRLFETTGEIDFIYGPSMNTAGTFSASIGLNDTSTFLSVSPNSATATVSNAVADNAVSSTQFLLNQKFIFTPQPVTLCNGAPAPGNTISSVSTICSNLSFNLSLENQVPGFGVTYQWQSSAGVFGFSDISGAFTSTLTISQTATTYYRCVVTCSGNSVPSVPVLVNTTSPGNCFCLPQYTNGKTDGDLISNVIITGTTLSNNTGIAPVNPYYTYFSGQPNYTATLQAGYPYQINVTVGTYQQQNVSVWIDYNDDAVFSLNERVGYSLNEIDSNGTGVFTITLDCNAPPGIHRMRVRDVWNTDASAMDPCTSYGYGETEDYDITIEALTGCQAPNGLATTVVNPTSAELVWNTGCNQVSWDLHFTTLGGGLPLDIPSNPNVTSPFVISSLATSTTYEFYVRATCGENGVSSWTGPFVFTTLPTAVSNDDCETAIPLIPGGTFEEHAVVGTNVGATKTIGAPNPTCAIFGFGGDVWFSTTVPADGTITIETKADPGSPFLDSGLSVFTGTCGNLTTIGCNDDKGIDSFSRLNLTGLTPGETLYIRVWEYANDTFGTFQVSAWNTTLSNSIFQQSAFNYFPNPVKDYLHLSNLETITNVSVLNMIGQEVLSQKTNATNCKIDVSSLPNGTYLVKIATASQQKTIKIIKE